MQAIASEMIALLCEQPGITLSPRARVQITRAIGAVAVSGTPMGGVTVTMLIFTI